MDLFESLISVLRNTPTSPLLKAVDFAHAIDISRRMMICPLQDAYRFRARYIALAIAEVLIDEKGDLQIDVARELLRDLERKRYLIGPYLENDVFLFDHLRASLAVFIEQKAIERLFQKLALPLCHKDAEKLIRDSLWPRQIKKISITDVKKAILAAWFTLLRQVTGSCFATAPAIFIQREQPLRLLEDVFDLLTFGSLRRVIEGKEYAVPLCPSLEAFDLIRPFTGIPADILSISPGLKVAFHSCGLFLSDAELKEKIEKEEEAKTPRQLIERILLRSMGLEPSDIKEEEELGRLDMNQLLARQSAVYYQRPSVRAQKVFEWKNSVQRACSAYQSLGDCALLRTWEVTIASFSDVKLDIAKWNLYVSLGFHPDYAGGIGAFLYARIDQELQSINQQISTYQSEYRRIMQEARNAQLAGLNRDYASAIYQANAFAQEADELSRQAQTLSELFSKLIKGYDRLIPESFQEIFDPSLAQNFDEMMDDSPAGFRLAFKHGRSASSLWTYIRSLDEFMRTLREFFSYAEKELCSEMPQERRWIEQFSTQLIQYIQTDEFLQQSVDRVKTNPAIRDPRAKPWEYISGGTMPALLMVYYNRTMPFSVLQRTLQNAEELLAFVIEGAKKNAARLLMHSPTHAFLLCPDWFPNDPLDVIQRMKQFWSRIKLQDEAWLAEKFSMRLPEKQRALFLHLVRRESPREKLTAFRNLLLNCLPADLEPLVDAFLYESLPLIEKSNAIALAAELVETNPATIKPIFEGASWITPAEFREKVKGLFVRQSKSAFCSIDIDEKIADFLRAKRYAAPKPLLFADTNWAVGYFGLAIGVSGSLELWRFQRVGMNGAPMRKWFALQCGGDWIILNRPQEYSL